MKPKIAFSKVSKSFNKDGRGLIGKSDQTAVLKDISFEFNSGQRVGLFGKNGSGKTTLLRLIAGITNPTKGEIDVRGNVVSLMELNAGFNLELSGRENILLNGMLLGMKRHEILEKLDQIISFSELEENIDLPFFTYSDGMKFRLAFSIAIETNANIILMDEVFAAGDVDFQYKTFAKIKAIQKNRKHLITIICSHVPNVIQSFANTYYEIKNGGINEVSAENVKKMIEENRQRWINLYK